MLGAVLARAIATFLVSEKMVTQCHVQVRARPGAKMVGYAVYAYDNPGAERARQISGAVENAFDLRVGAVAKALIIRCSHPAKLLQDHGSLSGSAFLPWEYRADDLVKGEGTEI